MASPVQAENAAATGSVNSHTSPQLFYSISDLAERWRFSRASVYNILRGERVVDFAANRKKGHKLVPLDVVLKIEREHLRVLR
jgi:hypothetical protein